MDFLDRIDVMDRVDVMDRIGLYLQCGGICWSRLLSDMVGTGG